MLPPHLFMPENTSVKAKAHTLAQFLRPHRSALFFGFLAVVGESVANLLEPWPLKIVLDSVLKTKHNGGWLNHLLVSVAGSDPYSVLAAASILVLIIAIFDGACTYAEKYYTTNVGQWIMHDLRKTLYSHIQRMSLAFHDHSQTGDLISRVTSDIDSVQSFITSNLLDTLINSVTLAG